MFLFNETTQVQLLIPGVHEVPWTLRAPIYYTSVIPLLTFIDPNVISRYVQRDLRVISSSGVPGVQDVFGIKDG